MLCACHGEPCYWNPDKKMVAGGRWRCAVRKREQQRALDRRRRDIKVQRQRDRYDNDPVYRIEKRLKQDARGRKLRLERRRAALASEQGDI